MSDTPTPTCPRCGASVEASDEWGVFFECGAVTKLSYNLHQESDLCRERVSRQKVEAELAEAKANAESWRVQSERWEKQLLETSDQLAETRKELARIREAVRLQCGVAFWDQIAGQQGVTTEAKEGK